MRFWQANTTTRRNKQMSDKKIQLNGVDYYNIDNRDNRDNKDNSVLLLSSGQEADASSKIIGQEIETKSHNSIAPQPPTPILQEQDVARCLVTWYDNGERTRQRYKLAIRINPTENQSEAWDFIANCNKDPRVFRRYCPDRETRLFGDEMRQYVKNKTGNYPYLGKIHANYHWNPNGDQYNSTESDSGAAVWWDGTGWRCVVKIYDYIKDIALYTDRLTQKQKLSNVKATGIWFCEGTGPRRNPTFKQRRQGDCE